MSWGEAREARPFREKAGGLGGRHAPPFSKHNTALTMFVSALLSFMDHVFYENYHGGLSKQVFRG